MHLAKVVAIIFASAAFCATAFAADAQRYQLRKEERNFFGFALDHPEGNAEFVLPFDKSFAELTAAQQALVKSAYVEMGDTDEPPYPVGGLKSLYEPITQGQQRLHASGAFTAHVKVDSSGNPTEVAVFRSPSRAVTKFVTQVILLTRFKPAVCAGAPCKMEFPVRISFAMR